MALIKKTVLNKKASTIKTKKKKKGDDSSSYELATKPNIISGNIGDYSFLIYGKKKIGKTTLCSKFPKVAYLASEPGTNCLAVRTNRIRNWKDAIGYLEQIENNPDYCETLVLDTVDLFYEYAFDFVCKARGVNHPNDLNDWGDTWREIRKTFRNYIQRCLDLSCGIILLSHEHEVEVEDCDGEKISRTQSTMSSQALSEVEGIVDGIIRYTYSKNKRFLLLEGSEEQDSGSRFEQNMTGVKSIDCGASPQETYDNLMLAFNNKQQDLDPMGTFKKELEKQSQMRKAKLHKKT